MTTPRAQAIAQALIASMTLPADDRQGYQTWSLMNNVPQSNDYDMPGFYAALMSGDPRAASAINPNDRQMHFPDTWKRPNHPSFSTESMYYNPATMPNTPSWVGGDLPGGGASWALRRPDGAPVVQEAPWFQGGINR